jgi:hypothetical protein
MSIKSWVVFLTVAAVATGCGKDVPGPEAGPAGQSASYDRTLRRCYDTVSLPIGQIPIPPAIVNQIESQICQSVIDVLAAYGVPQEVLALGLIGCAMVNVQTVTLEDIGMVTDITWNDGFGAMNGHQGMDASVRVTAQVVLPAVPASGFPGMTIPVDEVFDVGAAQPISGTNCSGCSPCGGFVSGE